jgi:hypothetical protein
MFLGIYRLKGNASQLLRAYDQLIANIPSSNLHLHVCVPDADGLWIYDSCPTRDIFTAFANSSDFRQALKSVGLPEPEVTPIGDIHAAFVNGKRAY